MQVGFCQVSDYPVINSDGLQPQITKFLNEQIEKKHFQEALSLLLSPSAEERQQIMDGVSTLNKIKMRECVEGDFLPSFVVLERLAKIPTMEKRAQVISHIMELYELGIPGAEEEDVLDFLIATPENTINPTLRIAKSLFFSFKNKEKNGAFLAGDYKDLDPHLCFEGECIEGLRCISRIRDIETLCEEQFALFDALKGSEKLDEKDLEKRFISTLLFSGQDWIRLHAFDLASDNYQLFVWMYRVIMECKDEALRTQFQGWMKEHSNETKFFQTCSKLNALNQTVDTDKYSLTYLTRPDQPFPKQLVAVHPKNINPAWRKNSKQILKCFLDAKFNLSLVENISTIPHESQSIFELKNDKYRVLQDSKKLIKNDEKQVTLHRKEWALMNNALFSCTFKGNRFEIVKVQNKCEQYWRPQHEIAYWNEWEVSENLKYYNDSDQMICNAVELILKQIENSTPVILDVGGGSGRLAEKLLVLSPMNYILLEKNEVEIGKAQEILGDRAAVVPTDIVLDPFCVEPGSVDIVIASGILTHTVLKDRNEALIALEKVCSSVKPGGFIILTGLSAPFITADDFTMRGFEVINKTIPLKSKQFYIARKV